MDLSDRMKLYEAVSDPKLMRRTPVIARLDGRAFHTFTKSLKKPFDPVFLECMGAAAKALCSAIQGAQLAYVQSDEISILITDWENNDTEPWFDYRLNKMTSISACIASTAFMTEWKKEHLRELPKPVEFDARFFNLPKEEVNNYFLWRQQDATRNSIQAYGQACGLFNRNNRVSPKELHGVNCPGILVKLAEEKQIEWNSLDLALQRGYCLTYDHEEERGSWKFDMNIPLFREDKLYVEDLLMPARHAVQY